jgi:hypothetical protein
MTQTINIPDHHGCNLTREQTNWPVFDDHQKYRGHITFIQSTAIPKKVYEQLKLGDRTDIGLFLTRPLFSNGTKNNAKAESITQHDFQALHLASWSLPE